MNNMASRERHTSGRLVKGIYIKPENYAREKLDRTCGVCMDVIHTKQPVSDRVFAILPNCNHCFCVRCIQAWRKQSRVFASRVTKGCPECRTVSFYYIPSNCWVDDQTEKQTLCILYKRLLAEIPCRYFFSGGCSFGRKCFYKHGEGSPRNKPPSAVALFYIVGDTRVNVAMQPGLWTSLMWH